MRQVPERGNWEARRESGKRVCAGLEGARSSDSKSGEKNGPGGRERATGEPSPYHARCYCRIPTKTFREQSGPSRERNESEKPRANRRGDGLFRSRSKRERWTGATEPCTVSAYRFRAKRSD